MQVTGSILWATACYESGERPNVREEITFRLPDADGAPDAAQRLRARVQCISRRPWHMRRGSPASQPRWLILGRAASQHPLATCLATRARRVATASEAVWRKSLRATADPDNMPALGERGSCPAPKPVSRRAELASDGVNDDPNWNAAPQQWGVASGEKWIGFGLSYKPRSRAFHGSVMFRKR